MATLLSDYSPSYHSVIQLPQFTPTKIKPFFAATSETTPQRSAAPAFTDTLLHFTPPSPASHPHHFLALPPFHQKNHPGLQPGKVVKPCPLQLHSTFA